MESSKIAQITLFAALFTASSLMAADQQQDRIRLHQDDPSYIQTRDRDRLQIFCQHLMSSDEIETYRHQYTALKTDQERVRFRQRHEEKMEHRAQSRGVTIPPTEYRKRTVPPDQNSEKGNGAGKGGRGSDGGGGAGRK